MLSSAELLDKDVLRIKEEQRENLNKINILDDKIKALNLEQSKLEQVSIKNKDDLVQIKSQLHQLKRIESRIPESGKNRNYSTVDCRQCGKCFASWIDLKSHLRIDHKQIYSCRYAN